MPLTTCKSLPWHYRQELATAVVGLVCRGSKCMAVDTYSYPWLYILCGETWQKFKSNKLKKTITMNPSQKRIWLRFTKPP